MTETHRLDNTESEIRSQLDRALPGASEDFNARLRTAFLEGATGVVGARESTSRSAFHRISRWRRAAVGAVAAATVLATVWVLTPSFRFRPAAWADVRTALTQLDSFSVTAYDERREAFDRIEGHFRAPSSWRIHFIGTQGRRVLFVTPKGSGVFDVNTRNWTKRNEKLDLSLMPADFSKTIAERGLLAAVLQSYSYSESPRREPVRNAAESARGELEVFDFVGEPSGDWMRAWVLPKSRLPLRVKVFRPTSDQVSTLHFDYSDPQSEGFFDLDAFDREVSKASVKDYEAFRIGKEPLAGRARSADQVHQIQGVRVPEVVEVVRNRQGDVLVKSTDPGNRSVQGDRLSSLFWEEAHDDHGNLYARFDGQDQESGFAYHYYAPVLPLRESDANEPPKLTLYYLAWNHHVGDKGHGHHMTLGHVELTLPEPTIELSPPAWPKIVDGGQRRLRRQGFYSYMPPLEDIGRAEALLAGPADSLPLLRRKLEALDRLDPGAADEFFEDVLLEVVVDEPIKYVNLVRFVLRRARRLAGEGADEEVEHLAARAKRGWDAEIAELEKGRRASAANYWRKEFERQSIGKLVALPSQVRALTDLPVEVRPDVLGAVSTEDGFVAITIEVPRGESAPAHLTIRPDESLWRYVTTFHRAGDSDATGEVRQLLVCRGDADRVPLIATEPSTMASTRFAEIAVPEPSVATLKSFLREQSEYVTEPSREQHKSTYDYLCALGVHQERMQESDAAFETYTEAIAVVSAEERDSSLDGPLRRTPAHLELRRVRLLRRAQRPDEALQLLDGIARRLPKPAAGTYHSREDFASMVIAERMEIAAAYLEGGERRKAVELVEATEKNRPDYRTLTSWHQGFPNGFSGMSEAGRERARVYYRYLPVDRMRRTLSAR